MELDYGVGQILSKLRQLGIQDNTFAFFSSDNGAATYAHEEGKYRIGKRVLTGVNSRVFFLTLLCLPPV